MKVVELNNNNNRVKAGLVPASTYMNYDFNQKYTTITYFNSKEGLEVTISRYGIVAHHKGIAVYVGGPDTMFDDLKEHKTIVIQPKSEDNNRNNNDDETTMLPYEYDVVFYT